MIFEDRLRNEFEVTPEVSSHMTDHPQLLLRIAEGRHLQVDDPLYLLDEGDALALYSILDVWLDTIEAKRAE